MPAVRFRTGLKLDGFHCSFCDARRSGRVFQEGARWMVKLKCGHLSFKGWVRDPGELEREGLVNPKTDRDPRIASNQRSREEEQLREVTEKLEYEMRKAGYPTGRIAEEIQKVEREFARAEIRRI